MSYLTYLLVGWVFLHEIWPGRRAHYVNYENINNSNLMVCHLLPFAKVGQNSCVAHINHYFGNLLKKLYAIQYLETLNLNHLIWFTIAMIQSRKLPFGYGILGTYKHLPLIMMKTKYPGKIYLYMDGTCSLHYGTSTNFTSLAVFTILRPISVALSRHQLMGKWSSNYWAVEGAAQFKGKCMIKI